MVSQTKRLESDVQPWLKMMPAHMYVNHYYQVACERALSSKLFSFDLTLKLAIQLNTSLLQVGVLACSVLQYASTYMCMAAHLCKLWNEYI